MLNFVAIRNTLQKTEFSSILILRDFWRFADILQGIVKAIEMKNFKIHKGIMQKSTFLVPLSFLLPISICEIIVYWSNHTLATLTYV